jgi:hypothetical protein
MHKIIKTLFFVFREIFVGRAALHTEILALRQLSLLFILSAAEILGYTTNVSRYTSYAYARSCKSASVVRADGAIGGHKRFYGIHNRSARRSVTKPWAGA